MFCSSICPSVHLQSSNLQSVLVLDPLEIEAGCKRVEEAFLSSPLPPDLEEQLLAQLAGEPYDGRFLAVRSSGTDEDTGAHSFAGGSPVTGAFAGSGAGGVCMGVGWGRWCLQGGRGVAGGVCRGVGWGWLLSSASGVLCAPSQCCISLFSVRGELVFCCCALQVSLSPSCSRVVLRRCCTPCAAAGPPASPHESWPTGWRLACPPLESKWPSLFRYCCVGVWVGVGMCACAVFLALHLSLQVMVASESSGVAFSRHPLKPISGNCVFIEAVFGLGEGLVGGELEADRFEVCVVTLKKQLCACVTPRLSALGQPKGHVSCKGDPGQVGDDGAGRGRGCGQS